MAQRLASRVGELARREPALTALLCMAVAGVALSLVPTGGHHLNQPLARFPRGRGGCAPARAGNQFAGPGHPLPPPPPPGPAPRRCPPPHRPPQCLSLPAPCPLIRSSPSRSATHELVLRRASGTVGSNSSMGLRPRVINVVL